MIYYYNDKFKNFIYGIIIIIIINFLIIYTPFSYTKVTLFLYFVEFIINIYKFLLLNKRIIF